MEVRYTIESKKIGEADYYHRVYGLHSYKSREEALTALKYHLRLKGSNQFDYRLKKEVIKYFPLQSSL